MAKRSIGYFFYNTFLALVGLIQLPVIVFRILTGSPVGGVSFKKNSDLSQKPALWIHAATEEQLAILAGIISILTSLFAGYQFVLTYTGKNAVNAGKSLQQDLHFIALPFSVELFSRRILSQINPQLLLVIEDPFYPNLVRHCKAAGVKIALIGGRVNHRLSLVYRLAPQFLNTVFQGIDLLMMNSVPEANRIGKMGAALSRILVSKAVGNPDDIWENAAEPDDNSLKEAVGAIGTLLGRNF